MESLATYGLTEGELFDTEKSFRSLGRMLHKLFNLSNILTVKSISPPLLGDVWLGDEDMQMMAARDREGSSKGLYVACWAGHNGQSHNHNDVGNFIIFVDGRPFIVDVGKPTYARKTFSADRYEIWPMQSAYHNLPTVNSVMQEAGRRYAARNVQYRSNEDYAQLRMDIASAYPEEAGVKVWFRTVRLNRGKDIQVIDSFELKEKSRGIIQNLITPCQIIQGKPGNLVLRDSEKKTELSLQYDSDKLTVQTEAIQLEDDRLVSIWGSRLYRILLKPKSAAKRDTWILQFSKMK
ncbi:hypothetical protein ES703_41973 [subsurface metagenome]